MQFLKASAALLVLALVLPVTGDLVAPAAPRDVLHGILAAQVREAPDTVHEALVTLDPSVVAFDSVPAIQGLGIAVLRVFDNFNVLYVAGLGRDLQRLGSVADVTYVMGNEPITWHGETATVATRAREAWDAKSTSTNPVVVGGNVIDGSGVGVAVVDAGIDATHPDLTAAVGATKKFVCPTPGLVSTITNTCYGAYIAGVVLNLNPSIGGLTTGNQPVSGCSDFMWTDGYNSDASSGHGTHVAGIVAGQGSASDGRIMGAAPGATLYGLGAGDVTQILFPIEAYNWVLCHQNSVSPAIKVVTNSWGSDGPAYDPANPVNQAINAIVAAGMAVTFSAGNSGGDGSVSEVNSYGKNPTPGVICVASYNDEERATRTASLSGFSSRGLSSDANRENWPDVSAPGDTILSALAKTSTIMTPGVSLAYSPYYTYASGTSMAAPHVAGILALILEANPSLTPAQLEDIVEDSAVQFTTPGGYVADSGNPTSGTNYGAGHGLIDAIAALQDSRVLGGSGLGSPLPQTSTNPHVYFGGADAGSFVAGAPGIIMLTWTEVEGQTVILSERTVMSGNTAAYPLSAGQAARVRVTHPSGFVQNLGTTVIVDGNGGFRVNANFAFPSSLGCACVADFPVEFQVLWGGQFKSFDRIVVRVV